MALPVSFPVFIPASALIPDPVSVALAAMALAILSLFPQPPEGVLVSPRLPVAFTLPAPVCIPLVAPVAVPFAAGLVPCAIAAGFLTGALPAALRLLATRAVPADRAPPPPVAAAVSPG